MENIVLFCDKKNCCGCGACVNICPKGAIKLCEDEYGYKYPKIDRNLCIKCGLCKKTCAYQSKENLEKNKEAYVGITKNEDVLMKSTSGGVFAQIAYEFIEANGIVYGCSMENVDNMLVPQHVRIEEVQEIEKLQGSKYVQSDINFTYQKIKKDLQSGKKVLFSGTPCQVSALKKYLKTLNINCEKLYTIDIICHGTPSKKMFQDYINMLEKKGNIKITKFIFRDKSKGCGCQAKIYYIDSENQKRERKIDSHFSSYYQLFLDSKTYRESCYSCKYACKTRTGDLTLGDYWGISKEHPEYLVKNGGNISEKNGLSCVLVNNQKGFELVQEYSNQNIYKISSLNKVANENKQLNRPSKLPEDRIEILNRYKANGYSAVNDYYFKSIRFKKYIYYIWSKLPMSLKEKIKR